MPVLALIHPFFINEKLHDSGFLSKSFFHFCKTDLSKLRISQFIERAKSKGFYTKR